MEENKKYVEKVYFELCLLKVNAPLIQLMRDAHLQRDN